MLTTYPVVCGSDIAEIDTAILRARNISHAALMEEAAKVCVDWLSDYYDRKTSFFIVCGPGNNGGDGLVIARRLFMEGYRVRVYAERGKEGSLQLYQYQRTNNLLPIGDLDDEWFVQDDDVIIDALFGVGIRGAARSPYDQHIYRINAIQAKECIAIDMPSGLGDEYAEREQAIVRADITLSLCVPKYSQLWGCCEEYIGDLHVLPLPHTQVALSSWSDSPQWLTSQWINAQRFKEQRFAHKGSFGRVAISAGSQGMVGAAIMTTAACLRSGAGLTTLHIAENLHPPIHAILPEVMLSHETNPASHTDILAFGPGWGQHTDRQEELHTWLCRESRAKVIDADALNLLAEQSKWLHQLPDNTILTPHPMEFSRLTGEAMPENGERITQATSYAKKWGVMVVLKGKYTILASKDGRVWVNPTGNSALAKGGSGDVLTGMITGYLAQGYTPEIAAAMAVYHHGLAADMVVEQKNARAVIARDIIEILTQLPK